MNRERFPGLADGWARFDAPAGSQPVDSAIEAMAEFMASGAVANQGGAFEAGERTSVLVREARAAAGSFVGGIFSHYRGGAVPNTDGLMSHRLENHGGGPADVFLVVNDQQAHRAPGTAGPRLRIGRNWS